MSNTTTLALNPNWQPPTTGKIVLYVQARHTSGYPQQVQITGPGITGTLTATSNPSTPFGTQFINQKIVMTNPSVPFPNWKYTVTISYSKDGGKTWTPSNVLGSDDVSVINGTMYAAFALSNDGGADQDFNDTVVEIEVFNNSTD